jgi:NDP-sugar pyrophosphorylase family protein
MILAAGLGTRLRPLTDDRPKALVTVAGRTLLEITLSRLRAFGVREVMVNAHHHANMIIDYLKSHDNFGMRVEVSQEQVLLDTGGGLKHVAPFFLEKGTSSQEPFLLHNVDVLSTIDLGRMVQVHIASSALATLAVQNRVTSRFLLFDEYGQLCGRRHGRDTAVTARTENTEPAESHTCTGTDAAFLGSAADTAGLVRTAVRVQPLAFCGVHVISPRLFAMMKEEGAFSIIDTYLRLAAEGDTIRAFRADDAYWRDLGRPESIDQAAADLCNGQYSEN